ncbi:MAG: dihydrofolate reductase family protein [Bryobacterales bacterium]|nr:dihydrofolate reductase family protein [Bryobacterales bacterium]
MVDLFPKHRRGGASSTAAFVHFMKYRRGRWSLLKSAVTLDGKIAAPADNSGWITSDRARAHVQTICAIRL